MWRECLTPPWLMTFMTRKTVCRPEDGLITWKNNTDKQWYGGWARLWLHNTNVFPVFTTACVSVKMSYCVYFGSARVYNRFFSLLGVVSNLTATVHHWFLTTLNCSSCFIVLKLLHWDPYGFCILDQWFPTRVEKWQDVTNTYVCSIKSSSFSFNFF